MSAPYSPVTPRDATYPKNSTLTYVVQRGRNGGRWDITKAADGGNKGHINTQRIWPDTPILETLHIEEHKLLHHTKLPSGSALGYAVPGEYHRLHAVLMLPELQHLRVTRSIRQEATPVQEKRTSHDAYVDSNTLYWKVCQAMFLVPLR